MGSCSRIKTPTWQFAWNIVCSSHPEPWSTATIFLVLQAVCRSIVLFMGDIYKFWRIAAQPLAWLVSNQTAFTCPVCLPNSGMIQGCGLEEDRGRSTQTTGSWRLFWCLGSKTLVSCDGVSFWIRHLLRDGMMKLPAFTKIQGISMSYIYLTLTVVFLHI